MRRSLSSRGHGGGGPLVTGHLQLHDLDLELELLKRKREMIEKQQQQIRGGGSGGSQAFNRPRPFVDNNYGNHQPFQGLQQGYNPTPFSQLYDEAQQSSGYGGGGLLGKRPNFDQPWQSHSTPKRFSGPQGGPKRKYNSGPRPEVPTNRPFVQKQPTWDRPQPARGPKSTFPSQRFNNQKTTKPVNRDFKPTKVTKPKQAAAANKPPIKQVKQFVNTKPDTFDPNFVLRDDQVPSQQLAGRLELALGNILKEIKTKFGDSEAHAALFQSTYLQRQMKQAIRERLRSVMMGKFVGKANAIVESYRKVFPVDTDVEIVQIALDAQQTSEAKKLAIKLEHAGNAYRYIKHNLNRLVGATLDDMFQKLQDLYKTEDETREICSKILAMDVPEVKTLNQSQETKDVDESKSNAQVKEDPEVQIVESNQNENKEVVEIADDDAKAEAVDDSHNVNENAAKTEPAEGETTANGDTDEKPENNEAAAKLDNLVLSLLKRRLPYILPRYKTMIHKLLNVSNSYQVTKTAIIERAQQMQKLDQRVAEAEKNSSQSQDNDGANSKPSPVHQLSPYMVKIQGRPVLPNRKLMQDFLKDYKPSFVKKHRSMHLLFVAFGNKEDFDKIVAVKEVTIGKSTITIKINEKAGAKSDAGLNKTTASQGSNESIGVSPELDEQIDDLLLSIRNEEEQKGDEAEIVSEAQTETNNDDKADDGTVDTEVNGSEETGGEHVGNGEVEPVVEPKPEVTDKEEELKTEALDKVEELKNDAKESGRATPTRASSRLANVTPSSVRTRRASRLANN